MAYYGEKKYRGMAVVIGNEKFDTRGKEPNIDRAGCVEDIRKMKQMFERLDFFVMCYKDLTKQQMEQKLEQASKDPRNADCECFVLVLSTHGIEQFDEKTKLWQHGVMGRDREYVLVEGILDMFDKKNATGLAGRPKLFFIQACRSKQLPPGVFSDILDSGVNAKVPVSKTSNYEKILPLDFYKEGPYTGCDALYEGWQGDPDCWSPTGKKHPGGGPDGGDSAGGAGAGGDAAGMDVGDPGSPDSGELPPEPVDVLSIKCPEDCLLYHPVVSGKLAFRNPTHGSHMMTYLVQQFPKLLKGYTLDKYLTFVNRAMAEHMCTLVQKDECKMTASILHRMTKHLKFVPKSQTSMMAKAIEIMEKP